MIKRLRHLLDLKLVFYLIIFYSIDLIIASIGVVSYKLKGLENVDRSWSEVIIRLIVIGVVSIIVIPIISMSTKYLIEKKYSWKSIISFHVILLLLYQGFKLILYVSVLSIVNDVSIAEMDLKRISNAFIKAFDEFYTIYVAIVAIIYTYYYFKKNVQNKLEKASLQAQLADTKMKVLKSQLQPHFLFNTLNSIHTLMDEDLKKSKHMLVDLSDLLRELVDYKDENLIELHEELKLANKYIDIVKIRFSDDLIFQINIGKNLEHVLVPSMLLQPIIENSIKHGYSKKNIELKIRLNIYLKKNCIIMKIENNGKSLDNSFDQVVNRGLGIKNTIERLKTLYKENFKYEIYNSEYGVTTRIEIPYKIAEFELIN